MTFPREVDARDLIGALTHRVSRGPAVRESCAAADAGSIAHSRHAPLRLGTLAAILADVAVHGQMSRVTLIEMLRIG